MHAVPRDTTICSTTTIPDFGDGSNAYTDTSNNNTVFTIPPSSVRSIGDTLLAKNISFAY
jgi:hypothetical protein